VIVVQGDEFNRSRIATAVCVALTSNRSRAAAPGNVLLEADETSLDKDSVANVSQIVTLDRADLSPPVGRLSGPSLETVLRGIDRVLGR
jgi:mRNA interferase MazF